MSPVQWELHLWTGGALNTIKVIEIDSTFAQILEELKINKISENLKNFDLKENKVKIQPCAQPTDLPKTDQVP